MSPELETLDQLQGGDLSLTIIRCLFPDEVHFVRGIEAMLKAGQVRLIECEGTEVPGWRWREVLETTGQPQAVRAWLAITEFGARQIG